MHSILQILLVHPVEEKSYEGRKYTSQSAECLILNDSGEVAEVGVLPVPESLRESVKPGFFIGTFVLRASKRRDGGRRIEAVLTGLQPYQVKAPQVPMAPVKVQ